MGEDPPLDVDVVVEDALVLEGPDVAGQLGVLPCMYLYIFSADK